MLKGGAVEIFRAAIKSDHTRDPYERRLLQFLNYVDMTPDKLVSIAKRNPPQIEKKILSFILLQKKRVSNKEITGATVSNFLKAIRLLLEMNDANLNWKKIRRFLPSARRYALDRIPTIEEIREIVDAADIRGKALTLLFLSSGIREGSIEYFQVQDYSFIRRDEKIVAGRLVVYRGEPEEHVVFCSPEAVAALDKYILHRKEAGEMIRPNSPLFRDKFDPLKETDSKPLPMTAPSVRQYYNRLLFSIGLRKEKKRRHEFSVHSMRKWLKTRCEIGGMKPINVETLLNHSTGISDSYYRITESELLEEYLAVIDHLSISTEHKLKAELKEAEETIKKTLQEREAISNAAIGSLSDQLMKVMKEVEALKKQQNKHLSK
jgi:integrase